MVGDVKLDKDLGFECMQVLIKANSSAELDECIRVINKSYPILRDQLLVMEGNLEAAERLGLRVGFTRIK